MTTSSSVLYFPSIEFKNDEWVKASLLLWDKIYRIVPKNYTPKDSDEIREAQENDLIRNIILEPQDISDTGQMFMQFVNNLPWLPAGLDDSKFDLVHKDKIDRRLYPFLEGVAQKYDDEGWLMVPEDLSRGYMFYLSKIVAKRRNLARSTDDQDSWTISPYFIEEGNFGEMVYDRDAQGFYSSLIIPDLLPANLAEVPMTKIVKFVENNTQEKVRFRDTLQQFADKLAQCESTEFTKQLLVDYKRDIIFAKNDLRKSMSFLNMNDKTSFFTMGVPVSLTAFGAISIGGDPFSLKSIFGSILIGAVAAFYDYKKVLRQERDSSYASFLLNMDKELTTKKAFPNFPYLFDQFVND